MILEENKRLYKILIKLFRLIHNMLILIIIGVEMILISLYRLFIK